MELWYNVQYFKKLLKKRGNHLDYSRKQKQNPNQAPGDYRNVAKPQKKTTSGKATKNLQTTQKLPSSQDRHTQQTAAEQAAAARSRQKRLARQQAKQSPQTTINRKSSKEPRRTNSSPPPLRPTPPPKKKKKLSLFKKRLILVVVLLLAGSTAYAAFQIMGNLNKDLSSSNLSKYGISSSAASVAQDHRIVNVAIFGVDGREDVEGERSDSTMIATADFEHGGIKITSLMRDTYVYIDSENDFDKLNAAYALGGPTTALKTINQNFDTAITDYLVVDFSCMVEMVNAVGGVTVDITSEDELYWLNQYLMDVNDKVKTSSPEVAGTGSQLLDGSQALAYCRIRYVGNGDFDRTQRQRTVFEQVINKAMSLNPIAQYSLIQSVMPYVKTSLSFNEILKYAGNAMLLRNRSIQQKQIPTEDYVETGYLGDVSYVFPVTLVDNIKVLYNFIYEINYTPSSEAQQISEEIQDVW